MKSIRHTFVLLLLACIVMVAAVCIFAGTANGRADFDTWSNRSARVLEPGNYNVDGTCSEGICTWKGVGGIGNLGIGNGSVSMMMPDVINAMTEDSTRTNASNESSGNATNETALAGNVTSGNAAAGNKTVGNATAGNETAVSGVAEPEDRTAIPAIPAPASNSPGNGTLVSRNVDTETAVPEETAPEPLTESLYPDYVLAASVLPMNTPYSITINTPFDHILAEQPVEAAALYGKLTGFPISGGQVVDVGIKCIGYEY